MNEPPDDGPDDGPDYGPGGYLPERAAKRARKIVLRAPLGLQWVLGAVAAGIVLVVVGIVFLTRADEAPGPPFEAIGPHAAVGDARYLEDDGVLLVGAAGRVRAFIVEGDQVPVWCEPSGRLESADGRVWAPTGRALDGAASLDQRPVVVVDGTVYLDPTTVIRGPEPRDEDPTPAC